MVVASATLIACEGGSPAAPPVQSAVSPQVLAPAPDPPAVALCTTPIETTADGRASPLLCRNGAVNVLAWRFYATTSDSLFRLGRDATQPFAEAAMCDDLDHTHSTRTQEADAFRLAAAYYGWTFLIDAAHDPCV